MATRPYKQSSLAPLLTRICALVLALSANAYAASENVCYRAAPAHACLAQTDPLTSCQESLETDPYNLDARFSLCEAYLQGEEVMQAWLTLDQGLKLCGRNKSACSRLQIALSNLEERSEQQAGDDTAAQRNALKAKQETQRRICLKRMKGNLSLNSCRELLLTFSDDASLHEALAKKLVRRGQPAQAVSAFRTAQALGADATAIQNQIGEAQAARQLLVKACMTSSDLNSCNRALLADSADESELQARRATLLRSSGNTVAALEAIIIAQSLDGKNRVIAKQLLELATNNRLSDARHYFARGKARATLGSNNAALPDLRTALARGHDTREVNSVLAPVLKQRQAVVNRECLQQQELRPCQKLIIASEPDRQLILQHMDKLKAQTALAVAAKQNEAREQLKTDSANANREPQQPVGPGPTDIAAVEPPKQTVVVPSIAIANDSNPIEIDTKPSVINTSLKPKLPTLVTYANQANKQGMTY